MAARTLRIFVSSPGDVGQERVIAARVLERLQGEFSGFVELEPILWEHEPLRATSHFQRQITTPSATDIVICILWSRLGTRLPAAQFKKKDGTPYESGTEWEFEDAAAAYLSKGTPDLVVYRKLADPLLDFHDEQAAMERLRQKKALDVFIDRWFGNPEEGFKAAFHGFHTADEFENLLDVHLRKLIRERLPEHLANEGEEAIAIRWFKGTPYRGLEAFEFEHAPVFYGRTRAIGAIKEALIRQAANGCAFLMVFGMSGGGKSSLVRAGVLPTITHPGVVDGIGLWRWCAFRPSDARQGDLFDGLAAALESSTALPEMAEAGVTAPTLAAELREDPARAAESIRQSLDHAARVVASQEGLSVPPQARLAVMVDQMEELFTREGVQASARKQFIAALGALARSGLVWVIGTMRSDFYPRCAEIPELVAMKDGAGQYDLLPPTFAEIGQMIRYPTRAAGLRFEVNPANGEGLDDVLHEAASHDPAMLPLLEFTLDELFRQRTEDRILTYAAYGGLGGLEGALAKRAEEVFMEQPAPVQQQLFPVLRGLVTIDEHDDSLVVSRRVPVSEAASTPERQALVDAFVAARLLVTDRADSGEAVVRVAHEALLSRWPRVQFWLAEDRDFLRVRARIGEAEARWREEDRQPEFLLPPGKPLADAADVLHRRRGDLGPNAIAFIEASQARATRQRRVRTWSIAAVTAAFFVMVLGFSVFSYGEAQKAKSAARTALRQQRVAEQAQRAAEAQQRVAEVQRQMATQQRQIANEQRKAAEAQRKEAVAQQKAAEAQRAIAQRQTAEATREKQLAQQQRRIAEVQRAVAERNFGHAVLAADTMVTEVAEGVKPIAGTQSLTVKKILSSAAAVYDSLLRENATPAVLEGKARMLDSFVDIYLKLNETPQAAASARQALTLYQRLHAQDPGNPRYQSGVARSYEMLSRVRLKQGSLPDDIAALRQALLLRGPQARRSPADADAQADVARLQGYLGNALHSQGDREGSDALLQASFAGWQRLAQADPGKAQWQQQLAASRNNAGDIAWFADDVPRARALYQQALATEQRLARQDPNNANLQKNLTQTYEDLAYVYKDGGDAAKALAYFDRAIALAGHFSGLDPADTSWLNLLLDCRLQRADVAKTRNEAQDLRGQLEIVRALFPKVVVLARQDPANAETKDLLCILLRVSGTAHSRLGQLGEAPRENWAEAYRCYQALRLKVQELNRLDPTNVRWESDVFVCQYDMGLWYTGQGRAAEGQSCMLQALQLRAAQDVRLTTRCPNDPVAWHQLAEDQFNVAITEQQIAEKQPSPQAPLARALTALSASEAAYRQALARQPGNAAWHRGLSNCLCTESLCWKGLADQKIAPAKNLEKAFAAASAAGAEYQRLLVRQPADPSLIQGQMNVYAAEFLILGAQGKPAKAQVVSAAFQQMKQRLDSLPAHTGASTTDAPGVGLSSGATQNLGASALIDSLHQQRDLQLRLYLSQPTTENYRGLVNTCLELAQNLQKTPTRDNLTEAQQTLALGYAAFNRLKDAGKLTPQQVQEQQPVQKTLADAFSKLPALPDQGTPPPRNQGESK